MVCGEPVVRPVVWVAFSLQNGLVDPITRKIYRCAGYKVKTFSLQRGGRAAKNTKKSMTFWLLLSLVAEGLTLLVSARPVWVFVSSQR